jgi:hypothetical protein
MPAASSKMRRRFSGLALINSLTWFCLTSAGELAPVEASANSNCTSRARTSLPLILKVDPAARRMRRETSNVGAVSNGAGALPSALSSTTTTSAISRCGRLSVPAKITSSISPPRKARADVAPITQRSDSKILDLPQPLGPTMPVNPGSILSWTGSTKDLKPVTRRSVTFIAFSPLQERLCVDVLRLLLRC